MEPLNDDIESYTAENLDGFPTDVVIAVLVARLGGDVTINLDPNMGNREGIKNRDLCIHLDFEKDIMRITLKD